MPVNRSYGGYSSHGNSAYSNYGVPKYSSGYGSSYGFRSGSSSPAMVRSSTPSYRDSFSYNSIINTVVPEEKNGSSYRPYYSPYSRSFMSSADAERKELKTYKTEELDTSDKNKSQRRDYAVPGEITRDTTINLPRGKAVVRMVTQKLKENPYLSSLKEREKETENLTLGQRLALKYQMKERPKPKAPTPPAAKGSGSESDWTWETCSSSEDELPAKKASPLKRKSPSPFKPVANLVAAAKTITQKYTRSNTATLCTTDDKPKQAVIPARSPATPLSSKSSSMNRWLEAANSETKLRPQTSANRIPNYGKAVAMNRSLLGNKLQEPGRPESSISSARSNSSTASRPVSWAGNQYTSDLGKSVNAPETSQSKPTTQAKTKGGKSDSSAGSSSPDLYKYRKPQKYQGAGSRLLRLSSSDDDQVNDNLTLGWRRGQPPRGEVVVKMTSKKAKNKPVIEPNHSTAISPVTSSVGSPKATPISSRVPAFMQDKYQIPGLMFKASTKREPVTNTQTALKVEPVKTAPVEEESEWEYYTESSEEEKVESTEKVIKTETTVPTSLALSTNENTKEAVVANQITQVDIHKLDKTTPITDNVVKTPATARASSALPSSHSNVSTSLNKASTTSNNRTQIDNVTIKHEISSSNAKIPEKPPEDCSKHLNKSVVNKNDHEDKSIAVINDVKKDDVTRNRIIQKPTDSLSPPEIQSQDGTGQFETLDKPKTLKLDHAVKDSTNTMNKLHSKNITTLVSHEPAPYSNISKTHQQSSLPPVKTDVGNKSNKLNKATLPQNIADKTSKHASLLHDKKPDAEVKNVKKPEPVKDISSISTAQKSNLTTPVKPKERQITPNVAKPSVEESKIKTSTTIQVHPEKRPIAAEYKEKPSEQSKPPKDQTDRRAETVKVKDIFSDRVKVESVAQNKSSSTTQTKLKSSEQDKTTSDSEKLNALIKTVKVVEKEMPAVTGKEEAPNLEVTKCKDKTAVKEVDKSKPKEIKASNQATSKPINEAQEERVKASMQEMVTSIGKAKVDEKSILSPVPKKTFPVTAYEKDKMLHDDSAKEFVVTKNEEKKEERKDAGIMPVHGKEAGPRALQTYKQSTASRSVLSQVISVADPLAKYTDPVLKISKVFQIGFF